MANFGVRWSEFNRRGELVTREKIFTTERARDAFVARVEQRESFNQFEAWLNEEVRGC